MSTGESLKRGWRTELQLCPQVPTQHLIRISRANKWLLADSVGSCQRETQRPRIQQPVVPVRVSVESVNEPRWPDKRLPFSARFYHTSQACPLSLCFRYINYCQHLFAHLWPDNNSSYSKKKHLLSAFFDFTCISTADHEYWHDNWPSNMFGLFTPVLFHEYLHEMFLVWLFPYFTTSVFTSTMGPTTTSVLAS